MPETSANTWPASAIRASEFAARPATSSTTRMPMLIAIAAAMRRRCCAAAEITVQSMQMREDKPVWSAVPQSVRTEAEQMLGGTVTRAVRAFGGYGPSATFVLNLADG